MGEEKQVILKPIRIRRIKYQPLEQTTGTDSDKASRGKGEEAGVEEEEEEDGRKEAIEEGIGLLEGTTGVDMAIRATTHHMVIVFTHPEAEDTTTHPGVEKETSLPGVEEESTLLGEEGEVVWVVGIPQLQ